MADNPVRLVLKNVPQVKFYDGGPRCPEDIPFPAVMRALMEYLGEEKYACRFCGSTKTDCRIKCSYAFFIGVSGVASFLNWKPGWEMDNVEIMYMSNDPAAPFQHAFDAIGYTYGIHGEQDFELYRQKISESIQKGIPVLAFGPVGPPESSIITGFDESGDVLIGWSFFQNFPPFASGLEYEPGGEYRKRDWMNYEPGLSFLTIGEKGTPPSLKETFRRALEWMIQVARTPVTFGDRANGLAAYDAWAAQLLLDQDFTADESVLVQRHEVHNNVVGFLAEARWYGSLFLISLIEFGDTEIHRDAIEDILHAAAFYAGEHQLMWNLWDLAGGNGNPEGWKKFAIPEVRRRMIPIIQAARQKEEQAIKHLEQALQKM